VNQSNFFFLFTFLDKIEMVKLIASFCNLIYFETSLMLLDFCWCFILFWDFFMLMNDIDIVTKLTNNGLHNIILFHVELLIITIY
jgi:hypothetical protein